MNGCDLYMEKNTWWISPVALILFVYVIVLIAFYQSESFYQNYGLAKYINLKYVIITTVSIISFFLGLFLAKKLKCKSNSRSINLNLVSKTACILTILVFLAYIIWLINFVRIYGLNVFNTIANSFYYSDFTEEKGSINGITTMTQFAVLVIPLRMILIKNGVNKKRNFVIILVFFLLALFRVYVFSERLAIIELFAVLFVSSVILYPNKKIYFWFPIIALVGVFIIFAIFEYFRSWHYYKNHYSNYFEFAFDRFFAYYTLAINTNSLFVNKDSFYFPDFSFSSLKKIPFFSELFSINAKKSSFIFSEYANSEYNNPGGVLAFYLDFNVFSFIIVFILGIITGIIFQRIKTGCFYSFDIMAYSVIVLTLIELPRYYYLGSPRGFYPLIGLIIYFFFDVKKFSFKGD